MNLLKKWEMMGALFTILKLGDFLEEEQWRECGSCERNL